MATRRVYVLTESHELQDKRTFSSLKKIVNAVGRDYKLPPYSTLQKKLLEAKKGDGVLRFESLDGSRKFSIEVKELE